MFGQRSVSPQKKLRCVVLIPQMKGLDMNIMVECIIVTKGRLILDFWVLELGVINQRADKEEEN